MSHNDRMNNPDSQKTHGHSKQVGPLLLGVIVLLLGWLAVAYFHVAHLPAYITGILTPNGSILRVTLIAALGGFILSIPVFRSLLRKDKTSQVRGQPVPQYRSRKAHPLFMTSRPARDANFVIRKTKNRGRISRNRAGERLPPSYQE